MNNLLITGASSDIGKEIIRSFANKYDVVWAHYRTLSDSLEELASSYANIKLIKADFQNDNEVDALIGGIVDSGLIPNSIVHLPAMKYQLKNFHKFDEYSYEDSFKISVVSIVKILRKILPLIVKEREEGRIVFMLSSCTLGDPPAFSSSYTTVKYSLLGLMKELAIEYGKYPIYINGLSPEMIETKFLSEIPRLIVEKNSNEMPSKRNLVPSDIMEKISYLLFDGKITGQNIHVMPK